MQQQQNPKPWWFFHGSGTPREVTIPPPPDWRRFDGGPPIERDLPDEPNAARRFGSRGRGETYQASDEELDLINAALYLRRPLLVTGKPGTGKSTVAYAIAHELKLGPVLRWSINTRTMLQQGLYRYDAIGRLQDAPKEGDRPDIGAYIQLGPLGTALLPTRRPRVLLIDEIDKSDIDLPNDLLNIFEEGEFKIDELVRARDADPETRVMPHDGTREEDRVPIQGGVTRCLEFPIVVMTSNDEREFPAPFLRRCLRLDIQAPDPEKLRRIVEAHLGGEIAKQADGLIDAFLQRRGVAHLATDQLLNAIYLTTRQIDVQHGDQEQLLNALLRSLERTGGG